MYSKVLSRPTLVLNRNWQPVNIASVARALTLVWNQSARVVDPESYQLYDWEDWARLAPQDDQPFIRTVSMRLRVPEIVSLITFDRLPQSVVTFSRRNIFKRDRYTCQFCGNQPQPDDLTIDHVVPRSQGGQSTWENCVLACVACNHKKANRTPAQAGLRLRKAPVRPDWNPVYSQHAVRVESWAKFISHAYWDVELNK
jgi:5-methylcytosine-specific restriction endonuclease McrA